LGGRGPAGEPADVGAAEGGGGEGVNPKLELIRELEKRGLWSMVQKAKDGYYSSLASPYAAPLAELVKELEALGHPDLAQRAKNGDFDHER
jgi:hypothetical protein